MFELGQIIPREKVDGFLYELVDEEMIDLYTGIFSSYMCKKVWIIRKSMRN